MSETLSSQYPNRINTGLVSSKTMMNDLLRYLELLIEINEKD